MGIRIRKTPLRFPNYLGGRTNPDSALTYNAHALSVGVDGERCERGLEPSVARLTGPPSAFPDLDPKRELNFKQLQAFFANLFKGFPTR